MTYDEWLYGEVTQRLFQATCAVIARTQHSYELIQAGHEAAPNALADEKKIPALIETLGKFDKALATQASKLVEKLEAFKSQIKPTDQKK